MNNKSFKITSLLVVGFIFVLFPSFSYAYLDPGTGSYVFQMMIAGLISCAYIVKIYFYSIKRFFKKIFSGNAKDDN